MKILFTIVCLFSTINLSAQKISNNEVALDLARNSMEKMYNLQTTESIILADKLESMCPGHPASTFLKALNIYWSSMPINSGNPEFTNFHDYLKETLIRSEQLLDKDKNNEEGIFFALASHGYLSQYYAEEKSNLKALKEIKSAYSYMKAGFNLVDQNPEFYYTTGLYNYYREQYPESHPGYKSFVWIFGSGDKAKGLQQLEKASKTALFTKTEAINYAAHIYLRYEDSPLIAEKYATKLVKLYPGNYLYRAILSETLLNLGKYWEVIPHINQLTSASQPFFNMIGNVYNGIRLEKQEKKFTEAKDLYLKVIESAGNIPLKTEHYVSMAYCGLARISLMEGNTDKAKDFYKKSLNLSHYPSVQKEASEGLKKL
ncbi:MAG: hypothetical protein M3512_13590 [Bacteroidota bacterium]|nr:hypothetical protein [Bacteroidota bacterium]